MVGVITRSDILAHPLATIRSFGWGVFFRAIAPWQSKSFLSLLQDSGHLATAASKLPAILERCVGLELRAKRIYKALASTFADEGLVGPFFAGLAEQEQYHADLLELFGRLPFAVAGKPIFLIPGTTTCRDWKNKWIRGGSCLAG